MFGIESSRYDGPGYSPVVDYDTWRVAFLNSSTDYLPENIDFIQFHRYTDEVFVLIEGECVLFSFGDDEEQPSSPRAVKMQPGVMYNVKKGVWHTHALGPNTKVLIVENRDTTNDNSPIIYLSVGQREELKAAWIKAVADAASK